MWTGFAAESPACPPKSSELRLKGAFACSCAVCRGRSFAGFALLFRRRRHLYFVCHLDSDLYKPRTAPDRSRSCSRGCAFCRRPPLHTYHHHHPSSGCVIGSRKSREILNGRSGCLDHCTPGWYSICSKRCVSSLTPISMLFAIPAAVWKPDQHTPYECVSGDGGISYTVPLSTQANTLGTSP